MKPPTPSAVSKAYEMFNDEEKYAYCKGVIEEAEALVEHKLEEKRALAKKSGKITIEEDDPEKVSSWLPPICCTVNGHPYLMFVQQYSENSPCVSIRLLLFITHHVYTIYTVHPNTARKIATAWLK